MMRVAQRQLVSRSIMPASVVLASSDHCDRGLHALAGAARMRAHAQSAKAKTSSKPSRPMLRATSKLYDLSLQGLREALATLAVARVEQEVQRLALFDRAASAKYMGALLVLNATGDIVISSRSTTPTPINLADRDYFQVHQYRPDIGLYISRPFKSRLVHREDQYRT